MNSSDYLVQIENFNFSYGNNNLFSHFDFYVKKESCVGIYGPTGTGKTTLLNKIVKEYINKLNISFVFQDNKLIEDLSVVKNIMLPLEKKQTKKNAEQKAMETATLLDLKNKIYNKVNVLSGGERQRVNIARALAYDCKLLLMDEPFSSQDKAHREKIIETLKNEIKERKITTVIVSHNREDLKELCSSVIMLG